MKQFSETIFIKKVLLIMITTNIIKDIVNHTTFQHAWTGCSTRCSRVYCQSHLRLY